ncbi:MAG: hypothetical protein NTX56_17190 [Proteobacteria bacterium]|nr:hypothetical protein [Pseudomonadota bacterium]
MPYEAYIGYVADRDAEIESGEPITLEVRDLDTYERMLVRAVVGKPGSTLADSDKLWIVDWVEEKQADPWLIKVLEELEEEDATGMRSDISADDLKSQAEQSQRYASGRGRGGAMPEMMGQEEARKFFENMQARKMNEKK